MNENEKNDKVVEENPPVPAPTPNTEPKTEGIDAQEEHDEVAKVLALPEEDRSGLKDGQALPAEDFAGFATDDVEVTE